MATGGFDVGGGKIPSGDERDVHRFQPAGGDPQKVGESFAGGSAVDRDRANGAFAADERPDGERDRLHALDLAQTIGHLVPIEGRLGPARDGLQVENAVWRKADGLTGQPVEGGGKEACDEDDDKTESNLERNQPAHEPAPRMRIGSALHHQGRPHGRGADGGDEAEQERHGAGQREAEGGETPVRGEHEVHRTGGRTDHAHDERRAQPGERLADGCGQQGEPDAFHQNQLHEPPATRADRDAQRHLRRPGGCLRRHQIGDIGARDQEDEQHEDT